MKTTSKFLAFLLMQSMIFPKAISGDIQSANQSTEISVDSMKLAHGRKTSLKEIIKPIINNPERYGIKKDEFTSQAEMNNARKRAVDILNSKGRFIVPIDLTSNYNAEDKALSFSNLVSHYGDGYLIISRGDKNVLSSGYLGSNAYGATVQILKQRGEEYGVFFSKEINPILAKDVKKFLGNLYEIELKIPMEPSVAKDLIGSDKNNGIESKFQALVIGEVVDPILYEDVTYRTPTIDAPYDTKIKNYNLAMRIEKIIVIKKSNKMPIMERQYGQQ